MVPANRMSKRRSIAALLGALVLGLALAAADARADDMSVVYSYDGSYDDAVFELEGAILDQGLKIDYVSHVGAMLQRTKADVGGKKDIFEHASVFQFCSAVLSRKVMEADPLNLVHCPYGIFVAQRKGSETAMIGYRRMPEGPMKEVEALLDAIARQAAGQ